MTGVPPPPQQQQQQQQQPQIMTVTNGPVSPNSSSHNTTMERLHQMNLSTEHIYNRAAQPPQPQGAPTKAGWRSKADLPCQQEEAIPSDQLYGGGQPTSGTASWREKQYGSRPSLNGMAHWSSHGYLAKENDNAAAGQPAAQNNGKIPEGYVVLKRQGDQMVTVNNTQQPQSLPVAAVAGQRHPGPMGQIDTGTGERKYFSVKGYGDMRNKHGGQFGGSPNGMDQPALSNNAMDQKYHSVDARYHSLKSLPPDIRAKLRENLRQVQEQQQHLVNNPYQAPPVQAVQYQKFAPPAPPPRTDQQMKARPVQQATPAQQPPEAKNGSSSVSWHEWTQQLQAYIAWVNSQLRKRQDLRPVQDLRTDLQSGEVLAQLIEIICKCL
jgi:hypothetical protein